MIIVDTCGLLWLAEGGDRVSPDVRNRIDSEPIVSVSSISALEIAMKVRSGKLTLPIPTLEWWERAVAHHRLNVIAPVPEIMIRSAELPPIHKDPADRIIIATALHMKAPVVTSDCRFREYGVETLL